MFNFLASRIGQIKFVTILKAFIFTLCFLLAGLKIFAQVDVWISQVNILESRNNYAQSFDSLTIKKLAANNVLDLLKFSSGISLKDYGGVGGIKTIGYKGFNSTQGLVSINGCAFSNYQTSSVDFSFFDVNNISNLSISLDKSDFYTKSAKSFSAAFEVNIENFAPKMDSAKYIFALKAGRFLFFEPNFRIIIPKNNHQLDIAFSYNYCKGNYPFVVDNKEYKRQNSMVNSAKLDVKLSNFGKIKLKQNLFANYSYRQLPKATTLYNLLSKESLKDFLCFYQIVGDYRCNSWNVRTIAKLSSSLESYNNPNYLSNIKQMDYVNNDAYFSTVYSNKLTDAFMISASVDGEFASLKSDNVKGNPFRKSFYESFSIKYHFSSFCLKASILQRNHFSSSEKEFSNHFAVNPVVNFSFLPWNVKGLKISLIAKKTDRIPSFNDLYYNNIGSRKLKAEDNRSLLLDVNFAKTYKKISLWLNSNCYYNQIKNKIVAVPTKNIFVWQMFNVGKVDIKAIEFTINPKYFINKDFSLEVKINHTYQHCLDVTDKNSATYKHQVAYTPRVNNNGFLQIDYKRFFLNLNYNYCSKVFVLNQNIEQNLLKAYLDKGFNIGYNYKKISFSIYAHNFLGVNYEIIKNFPMARDNFGVSLSLVR